MSSPGERDPSVLPPAVAAEISRVREILDRDAPKYDRMMRFPEQEDHPLRERLDHLVPTACRVERVERSKWGIVERVAARKPGP